MDDLRGLPVGAPVEAPDLGWVVRRHADACSVLSDARFVVPVAEPGGAVGTLAWLQGAVSRFVNGAVHAERRAMVAREIGRLDAAALRVAARAEAARVLADGGESGTLRADGRTAGIEGGPMRIDVMSLAARRVPVGVLWDALGGADRQAVDDVIAIAAAYQPSADAARADAAVARLLGDSDDVAAANRIGLLVQACDATAGLIGNALNAALRLPHGSWSVDGLIAETLRHDPPVWSTRRRLAEPVDIGGATLSGTVVLHLAAANRDPAVFADPHRFDPGRSGAAHLTFGHGLRPCPGGAQARALAAGVIEAVLPDHRLADPHVEYESSGNLRIPARLDVTPAPGGHAP